MTIESDSGYSPMALAVALGHKKSMYFVLLCDIYSTHKKGYGIKYVLQKLTLFCFVVQKVLEDHILKLYKPQT